jgi:hypothetical protein
LVVRLAIQAQDPVIFKAQLLTSDSLLPMPNVHIISKQMRQGTISNQEGFFKIWSLPNDSLLFTSVGFERKVLHLTDSIMQRGDSAVILLNKDTVNFQEVVVRSFYDWPTFKYLFVNMKPIKPVTVEWLNEELNRSLEEVRSQPLSIKGPIQALYDLFNHTARIQKRLERNRRWYNQQVIREGRPQDTIPYLPPHLSE